MITLFAGNWILRALTILLLAVGLIACDGKDSRDSSPVRGIVGDDPHQADSCGVDDPAFSCLNGSGNNLDNVMMGAADTRLKRLFDPDYADQISLLSGPARPTPRAISNAVFSQTESHQNDAGASDFLWQWGQFVDHDIGLSEGVDPPEPSDIAIPTGDPFFDPDAEGDRSMPFNRSIYAPETGTDAANPRQQINEITAWIDASNVYGSNPVRAQALRTLDDSGRLRTSAGNLLPFNTSGLENAQGGRVTEPSNNFFLAGDVRANEQVGLTAMHTLFVREHNRQAELFAAEQPDWSGERIYLESRRRVTALIQAITFQEFLPALLGPEAIPEYAGYDPTVDASIVNSFSTAAFRFGHSALSPQLMRLDADSQMIEAGHLALRDAFFAPERLIEDGGIEPILRGLARQTCQRIDIHVIDEVRNFLFGPPGSGGFDLVSLNIQRGRDHGLPGYNAARAGLGLPQADTFADISSDPVVRNRLAAVYANPDEIDLWVGVLAEDPLPDSHLGAVAQRLIRRQFLMLRDGDRYWYENDLGAPDVQAVQSTTLADVIRRNTGIAGELQDDVFTAMP